MHPLSKIQLFLIILIYLIIYVITFKRKIKEYLDTNWRTVKCYPHIIPIAGLSESAKGSDFINKTINNFNACSQGIIKGNLSVLLAPLLSIINVLRKALSKIGYILNSFRRMSSVIRDMFSTLVMNTVNRMKNSYAAIMYFQEKLKVLIKKQSAMFAILSQFVSTIPFLLYSFSRGPIIRYSMWLTKYFGLLIAVLVICILCAAGIPFVSLPACAICAICFPGNTPIEMHDGTTKEIKYIKIGDKIKGNTVKGKLYIKPHFAKTYKYNDTIVSGSHMVFENNKWVRIEDSTKGVPFSKFTELYCILTSNNTIYINGTKFRDYQECADLDVNLNTNYMFTKQINRNVGCIKTVQDKNNCYYWGFSEDVNILLDNKIIPLKRIIENPDNYENIMGIVELDIHHMVFDYKGILVSGNTLVYEDGIWIRVFQSPYSIKKSSGTKLYHLIMADNIVTVNSKHGPVLFRDFIESNDNDVNDDVDNMVLNRINCSKT